MLASGVSSGIKIYASIPAFAAYAAIAPAALPADGTATFLTPSSLAIEIAAVIPRALKLCVGFWPSSLMRRFSLIGSAAARRSTLKSGVQPSPRDTVFRCLRPEGPRDNATATTPAFLSDSLVSVSAALVEIVPNKQRLSAFDAQVLQNTGLVAKAAKCAFEMGYVHMKGPSLKRRDLKILSRRPRNRYFFQMNSLTRLKAAFIPSDTVPFFSPSL